MAIDEEFDAIMEEVEDTPKEEEKQLLLDELKIGYIVGLTMEGNFVFELFGQEKGIVELLGINAHADAKIKRIYDETQMSGDRLVHEVGKALNLVSQKLDGIMAAITGPKKPDNEIG